MGELILRPYQGLIADFQLDMRRSLIFAGMGMGKTVATLHRIAFESMLTARPALVVAPVRVARTTWPDEARKWGFDPVVPIQGTPEERRLILRRALAGKDIAYSINYELLPWLAEWALDQSVRKWPFGLIVADESTALKSFRVGPGGSTRAKALNRFAHRKASKFVGLTGTPTPNGLIDLWGQVWFVDQGQRLGGSFTAFRDRWFYPERVGPKPEAVRYVAHAHAAREIEERIADITLSIRAEDWFDLRAPRINRLEFDLPPAARRVYDELESTLYAELETGAIEAKDAGSKSMKLLQFAAGAVLDEDGRAHAVHEEKLDLLESIIAEAAGEPILVSRFFRSSRDRIMRRFPFARELDKDPATVRAWNEGRIPLLVASAQAAGHGLNLQDGGAQLVYFDHWWASEAHDQIAERIGPMRQLQAGHNRVVTYHYLVARDSVDEDVLANLQGKRAVSEALRAGLERRQHARRIQGVARR